MRSALALATEASYLDLSPPTDARPFFFNQLRLGRLLDQDVFALASRVGVYGGNLSATLTLAMLILISAILVAATIIVPLRSMVSSTAIRADRRRNVLFRPDRHRLHDG